MEIRDLPLDFFKGYLHQLADLPMLLEVGYKAAVFHLELFNLRKVVAFSR